MGNEPDIGGETGWEQVSSSWATKAKEQAGRSLAVSTIELVETLLLISWYEFGGDRDAVSCRIPREVYVEADV